MAPKVLLMGELFWAGPDAEELLGGIAELVPMESQSREEFFQDCAPGGRYSDIVGIYHEHLSDKIGAGYDSVGVKAAKARGIGVSNTPGAVDEATATTAVFLLVATMRRFSWCEANLRAGGFNPPGVEESARDLSGKTVGILGMGGIGLKMANYIRPFGCNLLYHNRRPNSLAPPDVKYVSELYEFLGQLDVLMVSIPLSEKTRGFVGEKEIRTMKKGSIIVNTARGPVIDEEAMIKALQDGHLGSVGLDVFTKEPEVDQRLKDMKHITLLPHVGTENQEARRKMERTALVNLKEFLTTGTGPNLVPECQ
ncbi:hypothetical protein I204_00698 [Kwoniella mangroviensis CBS 8886]|uniref:uncharacterized protein n=1 Tax=Kwoniella mangroviensis CBS 8507 TaxID=1296122 RepID=UPI00080D56E3|nr:uncharacterized protein I203_07054 [Kwoniella mangroviensis CBS 8507]OCF63735.1 hypothetical protein I203_07054 [Kwoniella mangroviensis CBS 8507]OCF78754.1 hypothetical protein I204_00698 [Kwoniella mangroviensis CBS 8886]